MYPLRISLRVGIVWGSLRRQTEEMSQYNKTGLDDVRQADASFLARRAEERRLCAIIESEQSSAEQKYDALMELAHMSGVLVSDGLANAA
jgi:hypothetical protein